MISINDLFKKKFKINEYLAGKWPIIILTLIYILSVCFVLTPRINANDSIGYYSMSRSLVIDFDVDLENEYNYYKDNGYTFRALKQDENTDKYYSQYPLGVSILPLIYIFKSSCFIFP